MDAVSRAIPVVVNDYGSFADYPHDVVAFVSPHPSPQELAEMFDRFPCSDMLEGAQRGRSYVRDTHAPERCAAAYARFVRDCVGIEESRSTAFAASRIRRAIAPMPPEARSELAATQRDRRVVGIAAGTLLAALVLVGSSAAVASHHA